MADNKRNYGMLFIIMSIVLLFIALLACFAGLYSTNTAISSYRVEILYLNRRIDNEKSERRMLRNRLWWLEERHEKRLMKLGCQYDMMMAANRGGWFTTQRLILTGAFDACREML